MNKRIIETLMILIFLGFMSVSIAEDSNQLGKSTDFPSDSYFYTDIDNYSNVINYEYSTRTSTRSGQKNVHLKDLDFSFWYKGLEPIFFTPT